MSDINHAAVKVWALEITADEYGNPLSAVAMAQAYLDLDAKLTKMSKYMSDCTPLQSDDFSRGESYGADCCARLINDVLDGKTDGVMCEPLGSARQRLIDYLAAANVKIEKYQRRLEITHCYDGHTGERKEIPPEKRDTHPDGIECRDSTIYILKTELQAERQRVEAMRDAWKVWNQEKLAGVLGRPNEAFDALATIMEGRML